MTLCTLLAAVQLGGVFPLLCTPYSEDGSLDCGVLAKQAAFVADCGADGVIWPPAKEALSLLTPDEERRGLAAIASALDGKGVWFAPCCPGKNTADMLRRVACVENIASNHPSLKTTMLVRMVDDAKGDDDYRRQYETLAGATRHPVIIQTYNGKSPLPSAKTLVDLARRYPDIYGWYKVEGTGNNILECARELVAAKPVVKTVFTGWGGRDWLYHYRQIGTRGVVTQRAMCADLMADVWRALETGDPAADDLFAKFVYLRNLDDILPSHGLRGWNLYALKKRGIFRNLLSRKAKKGGGYTLEETKLSKEDIKEIEARLAFALPKTPRKWKPIGKRKAKVVMWGIVHNHARGKFDALLKLKDDYEIVGWVDDTSSKAMRMQEPNAKAYAKWPKIDGQKLLNREIDCDLVVVECSNSELVEVSTKIALAGYPMHMDKPLGVDQEGYRKMSDICESRGIPLQIGYMFRSNEAINKMVELARDGVLGKIFSIDANLDHSYGYPKYPEYASSYPGGTAYLLTCHAIEWAMPIFNDEMPLKTYSIIKPAPGDPEWAKTHSLTIMEYPRANAVFRVCSRGTQPCRHIRIDGTAGSMSLMPIEDFRTVKHTTGLEEGLSRVDRLEIKLFLKTVNAKAKAAGYHAGINTLEFKVPDDRYAGQLKELARILRGEIPNPPGLYLHDLKVHKVSLDACNVRTKEL